MRKLYLIMAAALFIGCENGVHEGCLNGVKYYFYDRGLAPAYGIDQKVILCK